MKPVKAQAVMASGSLGLRSREGQLQYATAGRVPRVFSVQEGVQANFVLLP
ncbi:MAG: hypothetical protein GXO54_06535 [Chloroflexi bacterium]|nr:hypothetical protein [Chloroflexota bacterium]